MAFIGVKPELNFAFEISLILGLIVWKFDQGVETADFSLLKGLKPNPSLSYKQRHVGKHQLQPIHHGRSEDRHAELKNARHLCPGFHKESVPEKWSHVPNGV